MWDKLGWLDDSDYSLQFQLALFQSMTYFFFLYWSPLHLYSRVHHKNWLTYSGETDRPGELYYNFFYLITLLRWLTFLLASLTVTLSFHWLFVKSTAGCSISLHSLWLFSSRLWWAFWSLGKCSLGRYL